jgi:hypothetical protein
MAFDPVPDQYRSQDEVLQLAESQPGSSGLCGKPNSRVMAQVLGFKFAYY